LSEKPELVLVIFKRPDETGRDVFIAQCLNVDFVTHGETLPDALEALARCIRTQIKVSLDHGIEPFADFEKAPVEFWEMAKYPLPFRDPNPPDWKRWDAFFEDHQKMRAELEILEGEAIMEELKIAYECDKWMKSDESSGYVMKAAQSYPWVIEKLFIEGWKAAKRDALNPNERKTNRIA
jgi:hypothetical protein